MFALPFSILQYWIAGRSYRWANSLIVENPFFSLKSASIAPTDIKFLLNALFDFIIMHITLCTNSRKLYAQNMAGMIFYNI